MVEINILIPSMLEVDDVDVVWHEFAEDDNFEPRRDDSPSDRDEVYLSVKNELTWTTTVHSGDSHRTKPDIPHIGGSQDEMVFDQDNPETVIQATIEYAKTLYSALPVTPVYGYGLSEDDSIAIREGGQGSDYLPVTDDQIEDGQVTEINHITWLQILPPEVVDIYGRETILSAPAWRIDELADGSIMLVAHEDPVHGDNIIDIEAHLGIHTPAHDINTGLPDDPIEAAKQELDWFEEHLDEIDDEDKDEDKDEDDDAVTDSDADRNP